jgi:hypothetical protein
MQTRKELELQLPSRIRVCFGNQLQRLLDTLAIFLDQRQTEPESGRRPGQRDT